VRQVREPYGRRLLWSVLLLVGISAVVARAQVGGVTATVTPLVERESVAPGTTLRAALQVALPERFHVQSNKPRDPNLIATRLTFDAPEGVTVEEVVFPQAVDLTQAGIDLPLAVFEQTFTIGVRLNVAKSVAAGTIDVPGRLLYRRVRSDCVRNG
jgi:hypothetical protein